MTKKNESDKTNVVALNGGVPSNPPAAAVTAAHPGARLLQALKDRARECGHEEPEMARELGVTYGYFRQLENGVRAVNSISDDFSEACAAYLDLPRLQVLMLAERVTPVDLFRAADVYQQDVARAIKFIADDPAWSTMLLTSELRSCSADTLFGVIRLYEAATGTMLMPNRVDPTAMLAGEDKPPQ